LYPPTFFYFFTFNLNFLKHERYILKFSEYMDLLCRVLNGDISLLSYNFTSNTLKHARFDVTDTAKYFMIMCWNVKKINGWWSIMSESIKKIEINKFFEI
jgi:hypothetical protein